MPCFQTFGNTVEGMQPIPVTARHAAHLTAAGPAAHVAPAPWPQRLHRVLEPLAPDLGRAPGERPLLERCRTALDLLARELAALQVQRAAEGGGRAVMTGTGEQSALDVALCFSGYTVGAVSVTRLAVRAVGLTPCVACTDCHVLKRDALVLDWPQGALQQTGAALAAAGGHVGCVGRGLESLSWCNTNTVRCLSSSRHTASQTT